MVQIPERIDSKYRFVLLASKRAEQLVEGASPKQEAEDGKPTRQGMSEIADELIEWDYGPGEEEEALAEPQGEADGDAQEIAES